MGSSFRLIPCHSIYETHTKKLLRLIFKHGKNRILFIESRLPGNPLLPADPLAPAGPAGEAAHHPGVYHCRGLLRQIRNHRAHPLFYLPGGPHRGGQPAAGLSGPQGAAGGPLCLFYRHLQPLAGPRRHGAPGAGGYLRRLGLLRLHHAPLRAHGQRRPDL